MKFFKRLSTQKFSPILVAAAIILPLCFLFQNCSQVHFSSEISPFNLSSKENGAGYGGKPNGQYYRFYPDFKCEDKESYSMMLDVSETKATLTENKKLMCGAVHRDLDPKLIDSSVFQGDVIGYQEGIFEGEKTTPSSIPANLVGVWCRDNPTESGIETITHFDRKSNLSVNRIYFSKTNADGVLKHQIVDDFNVAPSISHLTITLRAEKDFELIVHRDQPAPQLGLFVAELTALIDGKNVQQQTYCRLGGRFDPQVWPEQQIVDMNVLFFKQSPDKNYFSYLSDTGTPNLGMGYLYTSPAGGQSQVKVSEGLSWANKNFQFSPDSAKLIYENDGPYMGLQELWSSRSDGSAKTMLSQLVTHPSVYSVAGDSQHAIFNSGTITGPWLKSVSLNGGPSLDLNPVLTAQEFGLFVPNAQNIVVDNFSVSPISNKVAFICCNSPTDLYITNADGNGPTKIPLPVYVDYKLLGVRFISPGYDKILQVFAWSLMDGSQRYQSFAVKADGSGYVKLPDNWIWSQTSPSGDFGSFTKGDLAQLINLNTGSAYALPKGMGIQGLAFLSNDAYESLFFTKDSSAFIGIVNDPTTTKIPKLVSVSTQDGHITELCPGIPSSSVREIENNVFVMVSNPANSKILNIYSASVLQGCQLINSVPVNPAIANNLQIFTKPSPDHKSLLLRRQISTTPAFAATQSIEDLLFYVPLDGNPALQINNPVFKAAALNSFDFTTDSKSVIYLGNQIRPSENNAFSWHAP